MKHLLLAGLIAWACGSALPVVAVAQAEHAVETAAIDPSWLQFDTATQAVSFQLIAGLTGLNGALNFNGFRDGGLTLTVPLGSNVVLHFRNHDGMLPHSAEVIADTHPDRKSTRLNSSHSQISYAVFCLKKKKTNRSDSLGYDSYGTGTQTE